MPTAYTPGLKVSSSTRIRRTRRLPLKGEVLAKVGDTVAPETIVAQAAIPGLMQSVKVAIQLGIEPKDILAPLLVKEGDQVHSGQVIAMTRALFGLLKTEVKTPFDGTVETISTVSGNVGIRQKSLPVQVTAYVAGRIAEVMPNEGVVVETQCALIQGIFGIGGERVGAIHMVSGSPNDPLTDKDIAADMAGKIIVGGSNVSGAALRRASEAGVCGIVVGGIIDKDLIDYLGYDIGVAITGHENIPLTVIITEGFGTIAMAQRTFDLLKSLEGKSASINGATQIRAGVIRPEVVVPLDLQPTGVADPADSSDSGALAIGAPIRLIREPYFGALATVTGLPTQLTTIGSGASVRVLEAKLAAGETVTVPRANVELIESS
jgi:hypothetical protein